MLDSKFWYRVGPNVRNRYRTHIFDKAKDVYGKSFKGYSNRGSKWVTINVKKSFKKDAPKEGYSYSQAKKGRMFPRQDDAYANKNSPVLTGDLYKDFTLVKVSPNGFQIGWTTHGAKIKWLKKMGRVLTASNQALPKDVIKYLNTEAKKEIKKKLPKGKKVYKVGK